VWCIYVRYYCEISRNKAISRILIMPCNIHAQSIHDVASVHACRYAAPPLRSACACMQICSSTLALCLTSALCRSHVRRGVRSVCEMLMFSNYSEESDWFSQGLVFPFSPFPGHPQGGKQLLRLTLQQISRRRCFIFSN
jgi:hypothetical protein